MVKLTKTLPLWIGLFCSFFVVNFAQADAPQDARLKLLKTFADEFVHITPGEGEFPNAFLMGSAKGPKEQQPQREVKFDYDFHIAKFEVPQNLWNAVMGDNPSRWMGERNSVEMLTHADAVAFCKKATELLRAAKLIEDEEVIRLPTEAEWEYVARAGTDSAFSFGDDESKLDEFGWYTGNAAGNDPPVGAKKPNPWGLYDIHGYLWEWTADAWQTSYEDSPKDGTARQSDGAKEFVIRGGSWKNKASSCTSRYRLGLSADARDDAVGLRCVMAKQ